LILEAITKAGYQPSADMPALGGSYGGRSDADLVFGKGSFSLKGKHLATSGGPVKPQKMKFLSQIPDQSCQVDYICRDRSHFCNGLSKQLEL
jgi:hypothetical protein